MAAPSCGDPDGWLRNAPSQYAIPACGLRFPKNCCNVTACGTQSGLLPASLPIIRAARGKCRMLPDLARGYARKSPRVHPDAAFLSAAAKERSDNPGREPQDEVNPQSLPPLHPRIFD